MSQGVDFKNIKICVILPICEEGSNKVTNKRTSSVSSTYSNPIVDFDSSIDSTCFSKSFISFTIKSLEK